MRPMFEHTKETDLLIELFKNMSVDKPLSFEVASKTVGFEVRSTVSAYQSARRIVERDGIVIEGIRKFGFVRLTGEKMAEAGARGFRAIRHRAKREARKQEAAIGQNLDQQHMLVATDWLGRFRLLGDIAQPARSNKPQQPAPEQAAPVDIRAKIRAIGG